MGEAVAEQRRDPALDDRPFFDRRETVVEQVGLVDYNSAADYFASAARLGDLTERGARKRLASSGERVSI